jgi:pimeloyl-ACP methyl ester carboxylesterase
MRKLSVVTLAISILAAGIAEARALELKTGIAVTYVEAGPKSAPPLILLHGLGDTSRSWALISPETAEVPPHVWRSIARTLMTDDQRVFLRNINTPTLILWGEKDPAFSASSQDALQRVMLHAKFKGIHRSL